MIIVVSYPKAVEHEASQINELFREGLQVLHLRKPEYSEDELKLLISAISPEFYDRIALHHHHSLHKLFNIKRLHYTEHIRKATSLTDLEAIKNDGIVLTTSLHHIDDYYTLPAAFNYAFLGPVFGSISKTNYQAMDENKRLMTQEKISTKLIALGGIDYMNSSLPFEWGFDGIALLGSVWEGEKSPKENFIRIKEACPTIVQ